MTLGPLAGYIWTEHGWLYDPTAFVVDYVSISAGATLEDVFKPSDEQRYDVVMKTLRRDSEL